MPPAAAAAKTVNAWDDMVDGFLDAVFMADVLLRFRLSYREHGEIARDLCASPASMLSLPFTEIDVNLSDSHSRRIPGHYMDESA